MKEKRPNPDELLKQFRKEEKNRTRGKLKIFFGAYPGVGKTYSMLEAARIKKAEGMDVVVGIVDAHDSKETEALLQGLEVIPSLEIVQKGNSFKELDLDKALKRRPGLLVVDHLGHMNALGLRHLKRWQDVEEILESGIDVYSTLNVQHLESLHDIVTRLTDVMVWDTVPDSVLENADELELVDLPPSDLLDRLEGELIYLPETHQPAFWHFFKRANLDAFREMALRITTDWVNAQVQVHRGMATNQPWPVREHLLVCLSASPSSAKLVRTAHRMAKSLRSDWIAVYVETVFHSEAKEKDREAQAIQHLRLAERLGAETAILTGTDFVEEVLTYARDRSVTKILVGKSPKRSWSNLFSGLLVNRLLRECGDIEVTITSGDSDNPAPKVVTKSPRKWDWKGFGYAFLEMVLCTTVNEAIFLYMDPSSQTLIYVNQIMAYLLGIAILSTSQGVWPCVAACILNILSFDYFFVPPLYEFNVYDSRYLVIFLVMLAVSLIISSLTVRMKIQTRLSRLRERRTEALYALSRELASTRGTDELLNTAVKHISEVFESSVLAFLPQEGGRLQARSGYAADFSLSTKEMGVAQWAYELGQMAGKGTETLPDAQALYVPLLASGEPVGALGIKSHFPDRLFIPEQMHLLEAFAHQSAMAILGDRLAEEKQQAQLQMETEKLRSSLLSSVSHDLRTPLATIKGSIGGLLESGETMGAATRRDFLENIHDETDRLERLVSNLLEMTQLEAGAIQPKTEPNDPLDVIGSAVARVEKRMEGRKLEMMVHPDLPLVSMDGLLIGQVVTNLLDNALKYTPEGSPLEISSWIDKGQWMVQVADRGPGVPEQDLPHLFDKFYRGPQKENKSGAGLGLAICRGIVDIHGGTLIAENRPDGGMFFRLSLPLETETKKGK
jgi:two-component system, OmpR family, sensor histidine kinase KdpD